MTIRKKYSALGTAFLFVLAFCLGYSQPAFPANPRSQVLPHYLGKDVLLQVTMATAQQSRHWIRLPGIPNSIKLPAAP